MSTNQTKTPSTGPGGPGALGADDGAGRRRPALWLLITATSVPMFMVALNNLVVSTALPTLARDLSADTQDLQWFVNAYVLAFACLLLTGAALGDRFGRRRVFLLGIGLFTAASVYCGLCDTTAELIAGRTAQGVGAAAVMPLSMTLLAQAVPANRRNLALGLWSAFSGLAVAFGPLVGGAVVDGIDWHWIFWINVPVCLIAVPLVLKVLDESRLAGTRLDLFGMVLATGGLVALVWGIVNGSEDGWTDGTIIGAFAAGVVLLAGFVAWEARAAEPMLPLSLYRIRSFVLCNAVSGAMYFGVFGSIFLLSQYLQIAPVRTPLEAGVLTLAWTLMPMFIAPVAGILTDRVGGGRLMALGLFLQAVGLGWIALAATDNTPYSHLVGGMIIGGTGMGFAFAPTAAVVLASVSQKLYGTASGANTTAREVGGALGIAVLATVFVRNGSAENAQQFVDGMKPAIWVGVAVVLVGAAAALAIPRTPAARPAADEPTPDETAPQPAKATATATA
ncbi:DHA2 family efflux MFS transporter permease subunit [Streptomyces sp. 2P-4]|uniref:DHA2 family efflux MFS transporter permease subunit n=1 Tax=Streptomyces sp. 2P-4 TaxID=2931974 RepID=UPI00254157E7|nr:DHA2 family efflux MFS transporter permease subunit [Streptomyces sp. 2P-4]